MTTKLTSKELTAPPAALRLYDPFDPIPFWNNLIQVFPDRKAYVVGGAVRDWLMGVEPKDVDVFVPTSSFTPNTGLWSERGLLEALRWAGIDGAKIERSRTFSSYAGFCDKIVRGTVTISSRNWPEIQIVAIEDGVDMPSSHSGMMDLLVSRVDFGLCRAGYHPSLPQVVTPQEFVEDLKSKTLTLYRADTERQHEYSLSRYARLTSEKYSGYTLVDRTKFAAVPFDG